MKAGAYMSNQDYIIEILELKDNNITFYDNFYYKEKIKGIDCKIFEVYLSYQPTQCYKCGVIFDNNFEKHGFITSNIKIPNVSPNTVERIMDSYYDTTRICKNYLPPVLSFDEFKSVKSADGAMSFHLCNGQTGKTIDIVEDRRLFSLMKYFSYYSRLSRSKVKFIVIDMYSPYLSLIKKMFSNASIIIDKFHLVQLISRSLNKTRIQFMKQDKKNYNKLKRYWKLLLKDKNDLDFEHWKRFTCFNSLMTESDVVNFIVNLNDILKNTYDLYQRLLSAFKTKDKLSFIQILDEKHENISDYMKTSLNTLIDFKDFILNTFDNPYHNGFIEGNNNFIKVLKRIAFGFRSFRRFKARIMICKGLISSTKKVNT